MIAIEHVDTNAFEDRMRTNFKWNSTVFIRHDVLADRQLIEIYTKTVPISNRAKRRIAKMLRQFHEKMLQVVEKDLAGPRQLSE